MTCALIAMLCAWSYSCPAPFAAPKLFIWAAALAVFTIRGDIRRPLDRGAVVYLLAILAATLGSRDLGMSIFGIKGVYGHTLPAAALLAWSLHYRGWLDRNQLLNAGMALALIGVAQLLGIWAFPGQPPGRAVSLLGSPIDFAALMVVLLPEAAAVRRWDAGLALLAGLWASGSRGAWLAVIAWLACLLPARQPFRFAAFLSVLVLSMHLVASSSKPKDLARIEMWRISWSEFLEHPILGTGPSTFAYTWLERRSPAIVQAVGPHYLQAHSHNEILNALATTGLIGLLGLAALVSSLWGRPELAGLAFLLCFNPISFEVLAVAVLLYRRKEVCP